MATFGKENTGLEISLESCILGPLSLARAFEGIPAHHTLIVKAHPRQVATYLCMFQANPNDKEFCRLFHYAWYIEQNMPMDVVECWSFDGEQVYKYRTIREVAVPRGL